MCDALTDNNTGVQHDETWKKLSALKQYAKLYAEWDEFKHSSSDQKEANLCRQLSDLNRSFGDLNILDKNQVALNLDFLQKLNESWDNKTNLVDIHRLADTFANMERRNKQGHYTDAMARAYTLIERTAAFILIQKNGLGSTEKPDWDNFNHSLDQVQNKYRKEIKKFNRSPNLRGKLDHEFPHYKLALQNCCFLLKLCGNDNLWDIYIQKIMANIGNKRNRSIIGHGTRPITKEDFKVTHEIAREFLIEAIGSEHSLKNYLKNIMFPELTI